MASANRKTDDSSSYQLPALLVSGATVKPTAAGAPDSAAAAGGQTAGGSLSDLRRPWTDEHLDSLGGASRQPSVAQAETEAFRRVLRAHLQDQMALARAAAWTQVQSYLLEWTKAASAAARAAEVALASAAGLPRGTGLPPAPGTLPGPWGAHPGRMRAPSFVEDGQQPETLFDLAAAAAAAPGTVAGMRSSDIWSEERGVAEAVSSIRPGDFPEVMPCASSGVFRVDTWSRPAVEQVRAEVSAAFPEPYRFAARLWELVSEGPAEVVEFCPDGGLRVNDPLAFASRLKDAFSSETASFARQNNKYSMRLRTAFDESGNRVSLNRAWACGHGAGIVWWHPLFLEGRRDLVAFVTPRNTQLFGPARYQGRGAAASAWATPPTVPVRPARPGWATLPWEASARIPAWPVSVPSLGVMPGRRSSHSRYANEDDVPFGQSRGKRARESEESDLVDGETPVSASLSAAKRGRAGATTATPGRASPGESFGAFEAGLPTGDDTRAKAVDGARGVLLPGPFSSASTVRPAEIRRFSKHAAPVPLSTGPGASVPALDVRAAMAAAGSSSLLQPPSAGLSLVPVPASAAASMPIVPDLAIRPPRLAAAPATPASSATGAPGSGGGTALTVPSLAHTLQPQSASAAMSSSWAALLPPAPPSGPGE